MTMLTVQKEKIKPGDIYEILFVRFGIDPLLKNPKREVS
jgi:hypothetical protein